MCVGNGPVWKKGLNNECLKKELEIGYVTVKITGKSLENSLKIFLN